MLKNCIMKIRKLLGKVVDFIDAIELFIVYVSQLAIFDTFKNHIKRQFPSRPLVVLANGPSLKQSLNEIIENDKYLESDFITVNFMANDDNFYIIKPVYHVISDYTLFHDSYGNEEKVIDFFKNLNTRVDWNLTIFVTYSLWKDKKWLSRFCNQNLKFVPLHSIEAPDNMRVSYILSKLGWLGANYGSVLHHAIYVGLLSGYKYIYVFGADHTFFDGLCVDEDNRVCRKITHFYDNKSEIKPIYHIYTGERKPYRMSYFMLEYKRVFCGHDILRYIAEKMGAKIINRTPVSLIDSYERRDY